MFLSVVMVRDVMPSPKDGIAVLDAKVGRSAPKISQRCATIKNVVAIIVAAPLEGAISLDMVAGRAAVKELDLRCSFLRLFFGRSTAWSSLETCPARGVRVLPNHEVFYIATTFFSFCPWLSGLG
jgi:hypothetical protein